MDGVRVAVIIVSWNVRELLDRCLASLRAEVARTSAAVRVWVVDNASEDGSAAMVRSRHPWVEVVASTVNMGYVRANNLVLRRLLAEGSADYVWLLNPDTEVRAGALERLLGFLTGRRRAGLAGPRLLNPDGSLQPSAFRFPCLLQPMFDLGMLPARFYESRWNGRYPATAYARGLPFRVDHPLGAAMMVRMEAVQQVGVLDEGFFMYCEEIDWAWRMRRRGWEVWLIPQAQVVHYGGASTGQVRPQMTARLWTSRARLYRKHCSPWVRRVVAWMVRRHFRRRLRLASSPVWRTAYEEILRAW